MRVCTKCGNAFSAPFQAQGGRPRTRCDDCRSNHAKIDGARWRKLRKQVLDRNPSCTVPGCRRPATQVDHIVPLAKGGDPFDLGNLRPICGPCNASKASRVRNGLPARKVGSGYRPAPVNTVTGEVARVEEHGNSKTIHYTDGTTHTETNLKW